MYEIFENQTFLFDWYCDVDLALDISKYIFWWDGKSKITTDLNVALARECLKKSNFSKRGSTIIHFSIFGVTLNMYEN